MIAITVGALVGFVSGKSKYRWRIVAAFFAILLLAVLVGFAHWYSLIAVPLSVVSSEIAHWVNGFSQVPQKDK